MTPAIVYLDLDTVPDLARTPIAPHELEQLAAERILLVLCSRRTRAEVEIRRQALGVFHPFVCEEGAAAFVPERYFGTAIEQARRTCGYEAVEFGAPYGEIVATLHRAADRLNVGVIGFSDMSVAQVAHECGMPLLDARLAKLREYGEWFRLLRANPVAERRLVKQLELAGLTCRSGGAFWQISSASGFGAAITLLTRLYRLAFGRVTVIGMSGAAGRESLAPHVESWLPIEGAAAANAGPPDAAWIPAMRQQIQTIRERRMEQSA